MSFRRAMAASLAAILVMLGLSVAAAPAQAAQVAFKCTVLSTTLDWNKGTPPGSDGDFVITADPASPAAGATVNLTLSTPPYVNGPIPRPAGSMTPKADVKYTGGTTQLVGKPQGALAVETEFQVNPMTGSIKAPASGKVDMSITKIVFDDNPVDINCVPTSSVVAGTFTVAAASDTAVVPRPAARARRPLRARARSPGPRQPLPTPAPCRRRVRRTGGSRP